MRCGESVEEEKSEEGFGFRVEAWSMRQPPSTDREMYVSWLRGM
jgi:hypothetical protein